MTETFSNFEIPQNYSLLINKLEKLALDLDVNLENITLARKEVEISISNTVTDSAINGANLEADYPRFISDIWIGVILTLLIVSIIFFICSCFLYHKFQQWKNTYRANNSVDSGIDITRRFEVDIESLPSYTIVSGLPTYDDALEEFRKAGIILNPANSIPIIKIFEADNNGKCSSDDGVDNISSNSNCICGALKNSNSPSIIELTPEQLQQLSQKRLSLQISFQQPRRNSKTRIDLLRQVSRNNMLRNLESENQSNLQRSSSAIILNTERNNIEQRLRSIRQHRGSLA